MSRPDADPASPGVDWPRAVHRDRVVQGDGDGLVLPGDPPVRILRDGLDWIAERRDRRVPVHHGDALVSDGCTWTLHLPEP